MQPEEEMSVLSKRLLREYQRQTAPSKQLAVNLTLEAWLSQLDQSMRFSTAGTATLGYQQKYADKLASKAKEQGLSVEALLERSRQSKISIESDGLQPISLQYNQQTTSKNQSLTTAPLKPQTQPSTSSAQQLYPPLDSIINVEKFKQESIETVGKLWTMYHTKKPHTLSGIVSPAFHSTLFSRGLKHPMFVLPLPRDKGFEFYILQFTDNQIYFTSLEAYKKYVQNAPPCVVVTHYTDIPRTVLMRGEVHGLDMEEARRLVYLVQLFYGDTKKFDIVKKFTKGDFDYTEVINAVDTLAS